MRYQQQTDHDEMSDDDVEDIMNTISHKFETRNRSCCHGYGMCLAFSSFCRFTTHIISKKNRDKCRWAKYKVTGRTGRIEVDHMSHFNNTLLSVAEAVNQEVGPQTEKCTIELLKKVICMYSCYPQTKPTWFWLDNIVTWIFLPMEDGSTNFECLCCGQARRMSMLASICETDTAKALGIRSDRLYPFVKYMPLISGEKILDVWEDRILNRYTDPARQILKISRDAVIQNRQGSQYTSRKTTAVFTPSMIASKQLVAQLLLLVFFLFLLLFLFCFIDNLNHRHRLYRVQILTRFSCIGKKKLGLRSGTWMLSPRLRNMEDVLFWCWILKIIGRGLICHTLTVSFLSASHLHQSLEEMFCSTFFC